jgi:hypothetical protein
MYLSALDLVAVMIALGVSVTLVITTALHNRQLDESRRYWRYQYQELKHFVDSE